MANLAFDFGKNWKSYSKNAFDQQKLERARADFRSLYQGIDFKNKSFLDIGFGQGLALYFAAELGANCYGIDISPSSKEAYQSLQAYFQQVGAAIIEIGSILDRDLISKLEAQGGFDIVHSWGVLHHTGDLRMAISNAKRLLKPGGIMMLALYDKHWSSPYWQKLKWLYNLSPAIIKTIIIYGMYIPLRVAMRIYLGAKRRSIPRGMDFYHDLVDWIGGYPYEYTTLENIKNSLGADFSLQHYIAPLVPTGNHQCVFKRD